MIRTLDQNFDLCKILIKTKLKSDQKSLVQAILTCCHTVMYYAYDLTDWGMIDCGKFERIYHTESPIFAINEILKMIQHDLSIKKLSYELKVEHFDEISLTQDKRRFQ